MEAGCLGKLVIRRLEISAPPPTSGEGRRAGGCVQSSMANRSCLCNEASVKTQKDRICEAPWLVKTWRLGENEVPREDTEALPFPHTLLYTSLTTSCS